MDNRVDQSTSLVAVCHALGVADPAAAARLVLEARWPICRGRMLIAITITIGLWGAWLAKVDFPWAYRLYTTLGGFGVVGALSMLWCQSSLSRIARIPEIRVLIVQHDRARLARASKQVMLFSTRLISPRICDEELGDLLESIDVRWSRGEPQWLCWLEFSRGLICTLVNAVRDWVTRL
jgi:hypothetical protein